MKKMLFIIALLFNFYAYCNPVVVGVLEFAPPFSSLSGDKTNYYGFTIDLMNAICKRINIQCTYKPLLFTNQQEVLEQGKVDIVFTPTPLNFTNNSNYIFSLPYLPSNGQFVTLKGNGINNIADLKNKKIGVLKISLFLPLVEANKKDYSDVIIYDNISDLVSALGNKSVDAIIMDHSIATYVVNNDIIDGSMFVGNKIPAGDGYGIFTLKKNANLITQINSALVNIESDGTYTAIYNKYFSQ